MPAIPSVEQLLPFLHTGLAYTLMGGMAITLTVRIVQRFRKPDYGNPALSPSNNARITHNTSNHQSTLWRHPAIVIQDPNGLSTLEEKTKPPNSNAVRHAEQRLVSSLTGIGNPERVLEVMEIMMAPPISSASSQSCQVNQLIELDQRLSTGPLDTIQSKLFARSILEETTSLLLGPTYSNDTSQDFLTLLELSAKLNKPFSYWSPTGRKIIAARERVMKSLILYLEEWWYLDGYGEINGISPFAEGILKTAKMEELTLEETAASLMLLIRTIVYPVWTTTNRMLAEVGSHNPKFSSALLRQRHGPGVPESLKIDFASIGKGAKYEVGFSSVDPDSTYSQPSAIQALPLKTIQVSAV